MLAGALTPRVAAGGWAGNSPETERAVQLEIKDVSIGTSTFVFFPVLQPGLLGEEELLVLSLLAPEISSVSPMKEPNTLVNSNWRLFRASSKFLDELAGKLCDGLLQLLPRCCPSLRARQSDRVTSICAPINRRTDPSRTRIKFNAWLFDDWSISIGELRHAGQNHSAPGKSRRALC